MVIIGQFGDGVATVAAGGQVPVSISSVVVFCCSDQQQKKKKKMRPTERR